MELCSLPPRNREPASVHLDLINVQAVNLGWSAAGTGRFRKQWCGALSHWEAVVMTADVDMGAST
jgi:hypothetical protein